MDEAVAEIAKTLKGNLENLSVSVQQLCDIFWQHEKRLQKLEEPEDIGAELGHVKAWIRDVKDPKKRNATLAEFATLCEVLGITAEV